MSSDEIDIEAVDRHERIAITTDGDVCSITNMFDEDGCETDDPDEALSAVAALPNGEWAAIDLTMFEPVETH